MSKLIKKPFISFQKGGYITKTRNNSYYTSEQQQNAVNKGYDFINNWYNQRKATGRFDDQLTDDQMNFQKDKAANTKVFFSNMGNSGGNASSNINPVTNKPIGIMRLNSEPTQSQWGFNYNNDQDLVTNAVHEWTHLLNNRVVSPGLPFNQAKVSPAIQKVSEITGQPLVETNKGDYLNNANETYSRLMQMRHAMKANPNQTYTLDQLKSYLQKFALPANETGVRLMNEVADNSNYNKSSNLDFNKTLLSKQGSKLIPKYVSNKK